MSAYMEFNEASAADLAAWAKKYTEERRSLMRALFEEPRPPKMPSLKVETVQHEYSTRKQRRAAAAELRRRK